MNVEPYLNLLCDAIVSIPKEYFTIEVAEKNATARRKRRERVYAYELYHQMRILQDERKSILGKNMCINAEIDKRGHTVIKEKFNPDIIIHEQGTMHNLCVIELKVCLDYDGIRKDINTIHKMVDEYQYVCGAFVMAGASLDETKTKLRNALIKKPIKGIEKSAEKIWIFAEENPNKEVQRCTLQEVLKGGIA